MTKKDLFIVYCVLALGAIAVTLGVYLDKIDVGQAIYIIVTIVLVAVTAVYAMRTLDIAKETRKQAEASIKMAEEMREQRITTSRPIVLQEAVEFRGDNLSDYFKIYNVGKGPAIELEIILLGRNKQKLYFEKTTFFIVNDEPKQVHYSKGLSEHLDLTCHLLCQYRSIDTKQLWYQTWLPFIPKENARKNGIIIIPQELEFREVKKRNPIDKY